MTPEEQTLSISSVGDRLTVDLVRNGESRSFGHALIDKSGKIYDFSQVEVLPLLGQSSSILADPDSTPKFAQKEGLHVFKGLSLIFPQFVDGPIAPGQRAADLVQENGKVAVSYYYRGVVDYQSRRVELFDLLAPPILGIQVLEGFLLWDADNSAPLLLRMQAQAFTPREPVTIQFDQHRCQGKP